eukprot:c6322_g1_i1.p1 GENE.c6322_g1_i1~~c6322_g1_i1.p1  ORF type:complete len:326 (-),score=36.57 c6322_g1_i1:95-1072(-)
MFVDKNQGDEQAEQHFKDVVAAYEVLSDKHLREVYDQFGEQGLAETCRAHAHTSTSTSSTFHGTTRTCHSHFSQQTQQPSFQAFHAAAQVHHAFHQTAHAHAQAFARAHCSNTPAFHSDFDVFNQVFNDPFFQAPHTSPMQGEPHFGFQTNSFPMFHRPHPFQHRNDSPQRLMAGSHVIISGANPLLQGQTGAIVDYESSTNSYLVFVSMGEGMLVSVPSRDLNQTGVEVHVANTGDEMMDNRLAKVLGFDENQKKYLVEVGPQIVLLDYANVILPPGTMAKISLPGHVWDKTWVCVVSFEEIGQYLVRLPNSVEIRAKPSSLRL